MTWDLVVFDEYHFGAWRETAKELFEGEEEAGSPHLGEILENHPERLDLKTKIAMTYVSSQNPMQGILLLREVIESDPENEEALYNLGLLSRQSGQLDKAIERFSKIVSINPDHIQARFLLAVTYLDLGESNKAKEQFEIVKRTNDDPAVQATVDSYLEKIN